MDGGGSGQVRSRLASVPWRSGLVQELVFAPLLRFSALVSRPDDEIDLAEGALLVADLAYPELQHALYLHRLDAIAEAVREELGGTAELERADNTLTNR